MPGRPRGPSTGGDPLTREEKAEAIAALATRLKERETFLAADFRGLSVKEMADFRDRLRESEAEFEVVKNTLARRAADEAGRESLLPYLEGPSGLVWVNGDPAAAAKALKSFGDAHDGRPAIKGGLLDGEDLSAERVAELAKLPSREEMLGRLVGGMSAPLHNLAGGLNNLLGGLARSLEALRAQRAADEPSEA